MRIYRIEAGERVRLGVESGGLLHGLESLYELAGEKVPEVVERADLRTICAAPEVVTVMLSESLKKSSAKLPTAADGVRAFAMDKVRVLAPIPNPGKIICIGLNYMDHIREQGPDKPVPEYPMLFAKFANTVCATEDIVPIPPMTSKLDYEGELAVVIARGGRHIPQERAMESVFGYTILHDVSARDLQKADGQWLRAKGMDRFAPMGPCVVTADEIPDPQVLDVRTTVNGEARQNSNTREMIFGVSKLISFISEGISLEPGDIISTGTPAGVGAWQKPPVFLKPGDVVEVEIEKIGKIRNEFGEATKR